MIADLFHGCSSANLPREVDRTESGQWGAGPALCSLSAADLILSQPRGALPVDGVLHSLGSQKHPDPEATEPAHGLYPAKGPQDFMNLVASDCERCPSPTQRSDLMRVDHWTPSIRLCSAALLLTALTLGWGVPAAAHENNPPSLYQRLGGYDAIAAVTDDFIGRLLQDPSLSRFFTGFSTDSKQRIRQHVVDQLCQATGGPCVYKGRDMKTTHTGIGISEAEWTTSVGHLVATLDKFKVPQKEKDELLALVSTLKADIVEK